MLVSAHNAYGSNNACKSSSLSPSSLWSQFWKTITKLTICATSALHCINGKYFLTTIVHHNKVHQLILPFATKHRIESSAMLFCVATIVLYKSQHWNPLQCNMALKCNILNNLNKPRIFVVCSVHSVPLIHILQENPVSRRLLTLFCCNLRTYGIFVAKMYQYVHSANVWSLTFAVHASVTRSATLHHT